MLSPSRMEVVWKGIPRVVTVDGNEVRLEGRVIGSARWVRQNVCTAKNKHTEITRRTKEEAVVALAKSVLEKEDPK